MSPVTVTMESLDTLDLGELLLKPAVSVKKTIVDFKSAGLSEYDGLYAIVLENVLSRDECRALVQLAERSVMRGAENTVAWERAMVNVGGGMQVMAEDTRKCGRIIMDNQEIVDRLWLRVQDHIPELIELANMPDVTGEGPAKRRETWKMARLNERVRFLKYARGEYFKRELVKHVRGLELTKGKLIRMACMRHQTRSNAHTTHSIST